MNNQHKPRLFFVQCQKSVWPIHMLWETIKHKTLSKWHAGFPRHFLSCESIEKWCCCTNFHFHRQPAKEMYEKSTLMTVLCSVKNWSDNAMGGHSTLSYCYVGSSRQWKWDQSIENCCFCTNFHFHWESTECMKNEQKPWFLLCTVSKKWLVTSSMLWEIIKS